VLGFLVGEALRDLRRAGRVAISAIVLITLSRAALGGFWLVSSNLGRAVAQWRDRVRIVVYLKREPAAPEAVVGRVRAIPGVAGVTYIGKADALRSLRQVLGKDASVVDQLPANPLPASLEVTPSAAAATPEGARDLLGRLAALPEADEVAGSADWIERLSQWQRLLTTIGLGVGAVLAIAAILTVTTASTLASGLASAQPRREDPLQAEQRKLQQTQKQLREEKERAAAARARETSLLAELEENERRLATKQREVARLEERIRRAQADVQLFRGEISRLEGHRAGQELALARRLRVMYRVHAQGGALPVILSGDDPVTRANAVRHLVSLAALGARLIK